jgi:molecular chaperone GrpE
MVDHLREQLARTQAEFDNYRKRQRREEQQRNELANLQLIDQLLPVLDNYDRALKNPGDNVQSLLSGIEMVHKQFADTLRQVGLEKIEPLGQPFDPNLHEAVSAVPAVEGQSDNTVVEVFQDGYVLNGRLIRPAMVQVTRT